jgi:hypothetical protein
MRSHVVAAEVVHVGLGEHRVICRLIRFTLILVFLYRNGPTFEFTLSQWRSIAGDNDKLGFTRSEAFEG